MKTDNLLILSLLVFLAASLLGDCVRGVRVYREGRAFDTFQETYQCDVVRYTAAGMNTPAVTCWTCETSDKEYCRVGNP